MGAEENPGKRRRRGWWKRRRRSDNTEMNCEYFSHTVLSQTRTRDDRRHGDKHRGIEVVERRKKTKRCGYSLMN